jgi:glucosamine-6-phosphate deaminase
MTIRIFETAEEMGRSAAEAGCAAIRQAIAKNGVATIVLATGASQFTMFESLVEMDIQWEHVRCFHLDEYLGIDNNHPASFGRYLRERFVERLPAKRLGGFERINARAPDPESECRRLSEAISSLTVDVAFVGIGENGHLAFNDPPADFATYKPYIVVSLDHECREQQLNEGWFTSIDDVPTQAISMSCREILRANHIIATVPDERKRQAVTCSVEGPISPECPASILQEHDDCTLFLDRPAASGLKDPITGISGP